MRQPEQWEHPQKSYSKIRKGKKPIKKMKNIPKNMAGDKIAGRIRVENVLREGTGK